MLALFLQAVTMCSPTVCITLLEGLQGKHSAWIGPLPADCEIMGWATDSFASGIRSNHRNPFNLNQSYNLFKVQVDLIGGSLLWCTLETRPCNE